MQLKLSTDKTRLYQKSEAWDFRNPPYDIADLAESMVALLYEKNGLGVAYNQLDLPHNYSLFAMRALEREGDNYLIINPKLIQASDEKIDLEEGCLSYPGLILSKIRPRHYRVRFSGPDGEVYTKTFSDLQARVFQHEFDHISGIPFWDGISRLKFDRAVKKATKNGWKYPINFARGI